MKIEACIWFLYFFFSSDTEESAALLRFFTSLGDACFQKHDGAFARQKGVLVANVFILLSCLKVSATVRRFLPGWVGLKKKRRNDVSDGNFGTDFKYVMHIFLR